MLAQALLNPEATKPGLSLIVAVVFMLVATWPEPARAQDTGVGIGSACAAECCAGVGRGEIKGV